MYQVPFKVGDYEVIRELQSGGMATVYLAYDSTFERHVAFKMLPSGVLHEPDLRRRFDREAKVIAQLEHPAIVPVYSYGKYQGCPYLVMRFMTGGSLRDRIEGDPIPLSETIRIARSIGAALDRAHVKHVVHRDIKPENILFDDEGYAYLADFGIARLVEGTQTTSIIGTPPYMAPEQFRGEHLDARTDVYQLGIVLFEMLTGQLPYKGDTATLMYKHLDAPIPSVHDIDHQIPVSVSTVIERAMAKEPLRRFASAGELVNALAAAAGHEDGEEPQRKISVPLLLSIVGVLIAVSLLIWGLLNAWPFPNYSDPTPFPTSVVAAGELDSDSLTPEQDMAEATDTINTAFTGESQPIAFLINEDGKHNLYLVDPDGSNLILAREGVGSARTDWSPDGKYLLTELYIYRNWEVLRIEIESGEMVRLSQHPADDYQAAWSPEGQTIAFVSDRGGSADIYLMDFNGNDVRQLTESPAANEWPSWSPDGKQIAFSSKNDLNSDIYRMDADGTNVVRLTSDDADDLHPAWSPDSRQIAFESLRRGDSHIYLMDRDGSYHLAVTDEGENWTPGWSPDAKYIIFGSNRVTNRPALWIKEVKGTEIACLTCDDVNVDGVRAPSWRP